MLTVSEIQDLLRKADEEEFVALERSLAADTRKGVKAALGTARKRLAAQAAERERLEGLYTFDMSQDGEVVVGLDEVGRGSVAGPLAVGAVVLPHDPKILGLNDSKQLSEEERESIAAEIREHAIACAVEFVEPSYIDQNGMSRSLRKAFSGALKRIEDSGIHPDVVLIDGNPLGLDPREVNVIKGDSQSASIAAASVLAKVTRDALMRELDSTYPQYGFFHNKGYASQDHIEAIRSIGLSPVHRASFCKSFMQESLF